MNCWNCEATKDDPCTSPQCHSMIRDCDPIETNAQAALGEAEEKLRRVLAVCDQLDARYLSADGEPLTSERQAGKSAGYSLAAHLIREALR